MSRLKKEYMEKIQPALIKELQCKNKFQVPMLKKIVLNMTADAVNDKKAVEVVKNELSAITGQAPVVTKAKSSIATFKLRQGMSLGAKVTLRGDRMYEFMDRLVNIALPRVRDFRGLSKKSFDGNGNYAFGIKEQIIFPEIDYDKVDKIRGFDVIICTTANDDATALKLLKQFNMPIN